MRISMRRESAGRTAAAAVAAMVVALAVQAVAARAQDLLPTEQQQGGVSYRTGGVGLDESAAMKAASSNYSLALTFVERDGQREAYNSGVQVTIAKPDGSTVLELTSDGPFLLVQLAPGKYRVTATSSGRSKTQLVEIAAGKHRQAVFSWPQLQEQ